MDEEFSKEGKTAVVDRLRRHHPLHDDVVTSLS